MATVPLVQENDASDRVKKIYEDIKERYGGFLPDIYKAFANDPTYLESINRHMQDVLAPRKIDAKTKEVIALVVGVMNQCDFCINAHTMGLKQRYGLDDEGIAEILGTTALWSEVNRFNIGARLTWPQK
ncbi:MAG: carboxymuconolactone decarboxylase family protein [Spirochaetaceae bacterium]|nr:carboxymuconolactone decarboxylase family protein [Spirochaetaceae bacterium]